MRFEGDKLICYWRVKNDDEVVGDVCVWVLSCQTYLLET